MTSIEDARVIFRHSTLVCHEHTNEGLLSKHHNHPRVDFAFFWQVVHTVVDSHLGSHTMVDMTSVVIVNHVVHIVAPTSNHVEVAHLVSHSGCCTSALAFTYLEDRQLV